MSSLFSTHGKAGRMEKLGDRIVDTVENARGMISDAYLILDSQYADELQPLIRFVGSTRLSFLLLCLLVVALVAVLFVATDAFKFLLFSALLGVAMSLWYGEFVLQISTLEAGLMGLIVCLVFSEALMVFLYHLKCVKGIAAPLTRLREQLSWLFLPYLRLTGMWGFVAAMAVFTFSAGWLGAVMAFFFCMRRRDARIAVFTGFVLQAIFWAALYQLVIPVFPHPLTVTFAVFMAAGLVVMAPGAVDLLKRRQLLR